MNLAERVRHAREMRNMSQNELEKRAGLSTGYVSRLESGQRASRHGVNESTLLKLAAALDVRAAWLLHEDGPMEHQAGEELLPKRAEAVRIAREGGMSEDVISVVLSREVANAESRSTLWWLEEFLFVAMARARQHDDAPSTSKPTTPRSKVRRKTG